VSYSSRYHQEMRYIQGVIADANFHKRCPICRKPQGTWPDGVKRITCGNYVCMRKWLPSRYVPDDIKEENA